MSDAVPAFARILELAEGPEGAALARTVASFLDTSGTAMGRATFYNSREEQEAAEERAHAAAFGADRTLYGVLAALPGTTDRTRGRCVRTLLASPVPDGTPAELVELETRLLGHLVGGLTPPRRLRLFTDLRAARVNNARTRRVILSQCLDTPKLELWAVRYRSKLRSALRHAWGNRAAGILRSVLAKDPTAWTAEERAMVRERIASGTARSSAPSSRPAPIWPPAPSCRLRCSRASAAPTTRRRSRAQCCRSPRRSSPPARSSPCSAPPRRRASRWPSTPTTTTRSASTSTRWSAA
ncbi:MAG: hypothetical protein ACYTGX_19310 [Planctomycetota bacterium]|jgi:hypothetical protein